MIQHPDLEFLRILKQTAKEIWTGRYIEIESPITAQLISGKYMQKWPSYGLPEPDSTSRLAIFEDFAMCRGENVMWPIFRCKYPNYTPLYSGKSMKKWPTYSLPELPSASRLVMFENFKMGRGGNIKQQIYRYAYSSYSVIYFGEIHVSMPKLWLARTWFNI